MVTFRGRPPGSGSGEMSKRTEALRPEIMLDAREAALARRLRRQGSPPETIARQMNKPLAEVEKALVQMRSPRPETTRGTLNITLAAHSLVVEERRGNEPLWKTFDRLLDELLRLRSVVPRQAPAGRRRHGEEIPDQMSLPALEETEA
jgi:hypothetical protein